MQSACENLFHLIGKQARFRPDSAALYWLGGSIDYRSLHSRAVNLAMRLAGCGDAGDRVGILAWNRPEFIELIYAAAASGRILVPLNARLAPAELAYQLQCAEVGILFGEESLLEPLREGGNLSRDIELIDLDSDYTTWVEAGPTGSLPAVGADRAAWILFTSGSTGRPKGALLTHGSLLAGLESAELGRPVEQDDIYLYPFPLFHVAAHNVLLQHRHGAAVALTRSFDAGETLRLCRELGVTTLSLAPTMIAMLLDHPDFNTADLATVRTIGYGASAMPATLLRRLIKETDIGLCQSYGMTELSGSISFLTPGDHRRAAADHPTLLQSVGRPLPTARVRLRARTGEILVRAAQCMAGYWQDEAATAKAFDGEWLHTGDVGRFDEQGYLYIVDRLKDMIVSGGENVASREVEEVLRRHPAVKDCAIIGLPDATWGELVCAVIVPEGEACREELDTHCRGLLAGYKTPRRWFFRDSLPLNASGKVDKPLLRNNLAKDRAG